MISLLSTLGWAEALAAATPAAPAAGSILEFPRRSLAARRRTLGSHRGSVTPWSGLFFSGCSPWLAVLLFTGFPRTRRVLTAARNALEFRGVFLLLHEIGDVQESVALQSQVDE